MPGRQLKILRRFGHRASGLAGFSLVATVYGIGLVTGYEPTFSTVLRFPTTEVGWAFIGLGLFMLTGLRGHDSIQYAAAVAGTAAWALLLATNFASPSGWAAGVSWAGVSLALLLGSAWANAPNPVEHLDLPSKEELINPPVPEEGADVGSKD